MNPTWFTEQDTKLIQRWIKAVNSRSLADKFVLICEGNTAALEEIRSLVDRSCKIEIQSLERTAFSLRMSNPPRSPRLYVLTSIPTSIQQSRLFAWLKQPGNNVVILIDAAENRQNDWRQEIGPLLKHEIITGPCDED